MTALAVGKFDALHLGHRALAERAARRGPPVLARLTGMAAVLGWPERPPLVAERDRARVLAGWSAGLAVAVGEVALPFADIRALDADAFVARCVGSHGATALVVGADFRCGRGRSAGTAELAEICARRGLALEVVEPVGLAGVAVSSSRVRAALAAGDIAAAADCLGRPHRLVGAVVRGDGRGRGLGFPTANLGAGDNLVPAPGVYAAEAELEGRRIPAAVNIGVLPTLGGDRPVTVEAHLVGWQGDCYGRILGLDLLRRVRPERRFASLDELRRQIAADVAAVSAAPAPR